MINKHAITYIVLGIGFFIGTIFGFYRYFNAQSLNGGITQEINDKPYLALKAPKDKIVFHKEVDDIRGEPKHEVNLGKIMAYFYISSEKTDGEFIFYKGKYTNARIKEKKGNQTTAVFYANDRFSQETDGVYLIKNATTTIEAFNGQTTLSDKIIIGKAMADTYYPTAAGGDGYVQGEHGTWATIHDATDVAGMTDAESGSWNNGNYIQTFSSYVGARSAYQITRGWCPIDTSAIGAGSTVTAASFFMTITNIYDDDNDGEDYIAITGPTTQASVDSLLSADFDQNSVSKWSNNWDLTGKGAGNTEFAINSPSGKINQTGYTMFGIREGHDIDDVACGSGPSQDTGILARTVFYDSGSASPYVTVTFSTGATGEESYDVKY